MKTKCDTCRFRFYVGFWGVTYACDYIGYTKRMRGCDGGNACTKYERGDVPKRRDIIINPDKVAEKRKEKERGTD